MSKPELIVSNALVWKHTANNMGVSFLTNNPILFYEWASESLTGFTIEHFEMHLKKMAKFNRAMSLNPNAISFALRVHFEDEIDAVIFRMRWC